MQIKGEKKGNQLVDNILDDSDEDDEDLKKDSADMQEESKESPSQ
jgi:hypothetical protein